MESLLALWKKYSARLLAAWNSLNLNQKVLISGALLLIITAIVVSSKTVFLTSYQPLFTGLAVNDAAAITAKLDELNIDYQLEDAGSTILVPADIKYQTRLQLASAGLPQGIVGFEIFNQTSFGETETDKKVKYQIALQGELTKTIQSLDKIEAAKVNLVIPEKSLYSEDQEIATASVLIKTRFNTRMDKQEIQGIVHLVANSVQGLKPENVTVVDTNGNVLSSGLSSSGLQPDSIELTQAQLALQRQYEREMQASVESMLERVVGTGKAVVRVNAELDFDQKESHMEIYAPLQDKKNPATFVRSEKRVDETSSQSGQSSSGAAGTESNIPTYQETNPTTESSSSDKSERIVNWEIDREEVVRKFAPGSVKRLTVAVIVDRELDTREKDEIKQLVETAVGIDRSAGDQSNRTVSVTGMKFSQITGEPTDVGMLAEAWSRYAWIFLLLLGLIAAVIATRFIILGRREAAPQFDAVAGDEIKLHDLLDKELSPQERERKQIRDEVEKLVDTNPEEAANLIRTWLLEEGV